MDADAAVPTYARVIATPRQNIVNVNAAPEADDDEFWDTPLKAR
jgi:hypothetical protein